MAVPVARKGLATLAGSYCIGSSGSSQDVPQLQRKSDEQVQTCNSCAPRCVGHPSRADVPVAHAVDGIVNFGQHHRRRVRYQRSGAGCGQCHQRRPGYRGADPFHRRRNQLHFQEFDLVLSGAGCTNDKKVSIAFDTVTNVDRISGNLMLMGPSKAKGVQIQIFNNSAANTTKIPLGLVEAAPQKATIDKNTATLKYKASYVSTEKTVIAGTGLSHIRYLLAYE